MNKQRFLSYNIWQGELHKGYTLDHKNLSAEEIQEAIDLYVDIKNNEEDLYMEYEDLDDYYEQQEELDALRKYKQFHDDFYHSD